LMSMQPFRPRVRTDRAIAVMSFVFIRLPDICVW
jgi:hypothetical protein